MSSFAIIDTSIYVDDLRSGRHKARMDSLGDVIRLSSVVLSELWRGTAKRADRQFLEELQGNHPILVPTKNNWLESGRLLSQIATDSGFEPHKLRDLHFDVLIGLTARSHGYKLITSNRADFELINSYRSFQMEIW
jgi:predicted nucleic acid-binding protein